MINLVEFIQRISIPSFIQIVVEIWNSVFLVIMIISLALGVRQSKTSVNMDVIQCDGTPQDISKSYGWIE